MQIQKEELNNKVQSLFKYTEFLHKRLKKSFNQKDEFLKVFFKLFKKCSKEIYEIVIFINNIDTADTLTSASEGEQQDPASRTLTILYRKIFKKNKSYSEGSINLDREIDFPLIKNFRNLSTQYQIFINCLKNYIQSRLSKFSSYNPLKIINDIILKVERNFYKNLKNFDEYYFRNNDSIYKLINHFKLYKNIPHEINYHIFDFL